MPDPEEKTSGPENGTVHDPKTDGVYGVGNGVGEGSAADYDTMDWKQIQAVITGAAAVGKTDSDGRPIDRAAIEQRMETVSNPASLWNAAEDLRWVQEALKAVGVNLEQQVKSLTGEDGPWQGEASEAFQTLMKPLTDAFRFAAEQIAGGRAGSQSAPQQLWAAGDYLDWARRTVWDINRHYSAEIARIANAYNGIETQFDHRTGRPVIEPRSGEEGHIRYRMDNGNIWINWNQQVVTMMSNDMRKVLKTLAAQYDSVTLQKAPRQVTTPKGDGNLGNLPNPSGNGDPNEEYKDLVDRLLNRDGPSTPDWDELFNRLGPGDGSNSPDWDELFNRTDPGDGSNTPDWDELFNRTDPGGGSGGPGPEIPNAADIELPPGTEKSLDSAPPGINDFEGITPPPGVDIPDLSGSGQPGPPTSFNPGELPGGAPLPGLDGLGPGVQTPPLPDPAGFTPGEFGSGAPGGLPGGIPLPTLPGGLPSPATGGVPRPAPFTPTGGPGTGSTGPVDVTPAEFTAVPPPDLDSAGPLLPPELPSPADWAAGQPPGLGSSPGDRGVPPMMPPMAPMSPPQGGGAGDRSDASGLIGGEVEPWEGAGVPGLGDPQGLVELPSVEPQEWAASPQAGGVPAGGLGSGVPPMMPPMAPMSPPQGGGAGDRSDASGLIGGEVEPWEGVAPSGVGDPLGLVELPSVEPQEWAASPQAGGVPAGGLGSGVPPMMPPMAPMSPPQGGGAGDRSDASGLIGGESQPWEGVTPAGVGDPQGLAELPSVEPQEWAASPQAGGVPAGGLGSGVPPMMPPMAPTPPAPQGGGAGDRSDASGLIGGESQPWEGAAPAGVGDPQGLVEVPSVEPQEWAASPQQQAGAVGSGVPPMMPPMAPTPPAPQGGGAGDRSDASGLIGGESRPWEVGGLPGSGDPGQPGDVAPTTPQEWAVAGGAGVVPDAVPAQPAVEPVVAASEPEPPSLPADGRIAPGEGDAPLVVPPAGAAPPAVAPPVAVPPVLTPPVVVPPATGTPTTGTPTTGTPSGNQPAANQPARQPDRAGGEGASGNPRKDRAAVAPVLLPGHVDAPATPPVDEDVVPVIDLDVEEDTSAWGATGAVGLLWGASKATRRDDDDDEPAPAPDYALRDSAPWQHSSSTAVRVQPPPATRPRDGSSVPKPYFPDDDMPMAGDQEVPEEVEEIGEPEADEEAERTASDLLKQDERVWGAPAPRVPGVIE